MVNDSATSMGRNLFLGATGEIGNSFVRADR
jgi:hypothetical protein